MNLTIAVLVGILVGGGMVALLRRPRRRQTPAELVAFTAANYAGLAGIHLPNSLKQSSGGLFIEDGSSRVTMLPSVVMRDTEFYQAYNALVSSGKPGTLQSPDHSGSAGTTHVVVKEKKSGTKKSHDERIAALVAEKLGRTVTQSVTVTCPPPPPEKKGSENSNRVIEIRAADSKAATK